MLQEMKRCEQTVECADGIGVCTTCDNPVKFITPYDSLYGRKRGVCGIHRRSIDKMYENLGDTQRCKELK